MTRTTTRLLLPGVACIAHLACCGLLLAEGDESALEQHAWKYRMDDTIRIVEGNPIRSRYHKESGGQAYVFLKPDGSQELVPCDLFSEDDKPLIAEAIRLSRSKQDSENAAAASKSDHLDRKAAMELCVRTREDAFRLLPRLPSSSHESVLSFVRHALSNDRFFPKVYASAVDNLHRILLPAVQSGDSDKMRDAMRQMTSAELAALDDFVLTTKHGKSVVGSYDKTYGEVVLACWRASLDGPAENYRPIFIEPHARDCRVSLPRGRVFDAASYLPAQGVRAIFEKAEKREKDLSTLIPRHTNGVPFAILKHIGNKLNGTAIAQFADGGLMMNGNYNNNERHGKFLVMTEDRSIKYAAEYDHGDKHGLVCVFRSGRPLLVQECANNKPRFTYLVDEKGQIGEQHEGVPSVASKPFLAALAFLERTEDELLQNEKDVKEYVEKVEDSVRRWRAATNATLALSRFNELQTLRSTADAALMGSLHQMSLAR